MLIPIIIIQGETGRESKEFETWWANPIVLRRKERLVPPMMRKMTIQVIVAVRTKALCKAAQETFFRNSANNRAPVVPIAADSVGVVMPV